MVETEQNRHASSSPYTPTTPSRKIVRSFHHVQEGGCCGALVGVTGLLVLWEETNRQRPCMHHSSHRHMHVGYWKRKGHQRRLPENQLPPSFLALPWLHMPSEQLWGFTNAGTHAPPFSHNPINTLFSCHARAPLPFSSRHVLEYTSLSLTISPSPQNRTTRPKPPQATKHEAPGFYACLAFCTSPGRRFPGPPTRSARLPSRGKFLDAHPHRHGFVRLVLGPGYAGACGRLEPLD